MATGEGPARRGTPLLFLAAVVTSLLLAELAYRILSPQPSYEDWRRASLRYRHHPVYHWRLVPGTYPTEYATIRINQMGLRGEEIEVPKPSGRIRILVLGGSSTFNYKAAGGRPWPDRLDDHLADALRADVEVINGGVPGYSAYQSSMRFEPELADLGSDLVLVYHLWNDLKLFWMNEPDEIIAQWDRNGRNLQSTAILEPSPLLDFLSRVSHLVRLFRFTMVRAHLDANTGDEGWIHTELDHSITSEGIDFYRANLERIANAAGRRGIPLGLIQQATLIAPEAPEAVRKRIKYRFTGFDHETLVEAVKRGRPVTQELAQRPGVWEISTDDFPADLDHLRDHVHLTDAGLDTLVEVIGPQVVEILRATTAP